VRLEDEVTRQAEELAQHQLELTARVIRLEAQLDLMTSAAIGRWLRGGR
jgi:hypothetical protein